MSGEFFVCLWWSLVGLVWLAPVVYGRRKRQVKPVACAHMNWVEVLSVEHKLVSYLCLNEACEKSLYAVEWVRDGEDVWKPGSCPCLPQLQQFSVSCPVKNHSGWAQVELKAKEPVYQPAHDLYACYCDECDAQIVKHAGLLQATRLLCAPHVYYGNECAICGDRFDDCEEVKEIVSATEYMRSSYGIFSNTSKYYKHDKEILMRQLDRKRKQK